jgi:hypothetical protein
MIFKLMLVKRRVADALRRDGLPNGLYSGTVPNIRLTISRYGRL